LNACACKAGAGLNGMLPVSCTYPALKGLVYFYRNRKADGREHGINNGSGMILDTAQAAAVKYAPNAPI
jgi:hypothetical protein